MVGRKLALVIGNNYSNSNKELKFAVADAIKMKEVLENICDFDHADILINKTSREASSELEKIFKSIRPDDLIFIYFSGHGKKDLTNNLYLLFEDTNEEFLLSTSLPFDFINTCRKYPQTPHVSVIIVLDCCYSGAAGIRDADSDVIEALEKPSGLGTIILTSTGSTGAPQAREDEKFGHGVFTYYLIEGLEKGYADQDRDGYISIDDLYEYACEQTKDNSSQHPAKKGSIEGKIYIRMNLPVIKEKEHKLKQIKLFDEYGDKLPNDVLDECQAVLRKEFKSPSELNKEDRLVLGRMKPLLNGKLRNEKLNEAIENCIEAVKYKKEKEEERKKKEKENEIKRKEEERKKKEKEDEIKRKEEERKKEEKKNIQKARFVTSIIVVGFLILLVASPLDSHKNDVNTPQAVNMIDQTNLSSRSQIDNTTQTSSSKDLEADFNVSNLVLDPIEVSAGKNTKISANIENVGNAAGNKNIELSVNGNVTDSKEVSLDIGKNTTVTFEHAEEVPGNYMVEVGGATAIYTVKEKSSFILLYSLIAIILLIVGGAAYFFTKGGGDIGVLQEKFIEFTRK